MGSNKGSTAPRTLTALIDRACQEFPRKRALVVPEKSVLSFADIHHAVTHGAASLRNAGVRPSDVVALSFPNTAEYVVAFLSVLKARAVAAPLNPAYTKDEYEFYLEDSRSKLLLHQNNSQAVDAAGALGIAAAAAELYRDPQSALLFLNISPLPNLSTPNENTLPESENAEDDKALFLHTSGTTSRPKGVPLTQLNLATSTQNIRAAYELSPTDATVLVLPLFHVHGLIAALLTSLLAGSTVVLPSAGRFSATTFWKDMRDQGATWYTAVPTIHQILLERHACRPEPEYPRLRFIRSCSAALAPAVLQCMEEAFGAPVLEAYAMTEASHMMTTNPLPHRGGRKPGSVGLPVVQERAILNEEGAAQAAGVKGEVCIRGMSVTRGYENNPEANKSAFRFGWFHTGDLGYLDEEGYLFLVGRIKELINRGGEKISPAEVDSVLLSFPAVKEAVAFGMPDEKYGEEVNAAVVAKEGEAVTEADVIEFCRKNLAAFKMPKRVFVTEKIPRTATGKVQRRAVAEHFIASVSGAAKLPKFGA
eukprot:TRINITY_DN871_c0_g1_i2.p1 TRINITY_DN871_c0_g1~~TRINITY_DN871_c0_g1_i2.p1  ORF type:complete len:536 (+),score=-24.97 TRINITY_DN871_c0_g1_i2:438-2045(+)